MCGARGAGRRQSFTESGIQRQNQIYLMTGDLLANVRMIFTNIVCTIKRLKNRTSLLHWLSHYTKLLALDEVEYVYRKYISSRNLNENAIF